MAEAKITLLTAPVEIVGPWGDSLPQAARQVVLWMRAACLAGVELKSDRQPERLRIEDHTSGPPAIWLHAQPPTTAWVIVDIGTRDWCKLAYQFGHELGHVFANSWNAAAWPRPPCQWLEESLVEAFSIRGLGHLADEWARDPPFYGDAAFSGAIRQYRSDLIERYRKAGGGIEGAALAGWLRARRGLRSGHGLRRRPRRAEPVAGKNGPSAGGLSHEVDGELRRDRRPGAPARSIEASVRPELKSPLAAARIVTAAERPRRRIG
jgi:hypothetical protein